MKDEFNNVDCKGLQNCRGCINCHNSTFCNNSTSCHNSTYCIYCNDLVLEKFQIFNKQIKNKVEYLKIRNKIQFHLGFCKHPKDLTKKDINWLKKNIKQFDLKVLNEIIKKSIKSDKPKVN